mmetsp:Transcript_20002/g.40745  ORF Transcript_20002/g.40745 Transcript_20002/m.40745 type:complete len:231 (-) Transcript_20002:755-1447(-)
MLFTRDSDPACPYALCDAASEPSTNSLACSVGDTDSDPVTSSPPVSLCTAAADAADAADAAAAAPCSEMGFTRAREPACPNALPDAAREPSTSSFACSVGDTSSEPLTSSPPFSLCTMRALSVDSAPPAMSSPFTCESAPPEDLLVSSFHELSSTFDDHPSSCTGAIHPRSPPMLRMKRLPPVFSASLANFGLNTPSVATSSGRVCESAPPAVFGSAPSCISTPPSSPTS